MKAACAVRCRGRVRLGQQGALCVRKKRSPLIVTRCFPNHTHTKMINEEEGEPGVGGVVLLLLQEMDGRAERSRVTILIQKLCNMTRAHR